MKQPVVIGLSASLRNARNRAGSRELIGDLRELPSREALHDYLVEQGNLHLDQYFQAGRKDNLPYDQMYRELRKMGGRKGLSNSEVCLAAALWGAHSEGAEIDHLPLSDYFHADGSRGDMDELRRAILRADGLLISTPVYFGDRSSLSQSLIEMIRRDPELRASLAGQGLRRPGRGRQAQRRPGDHPHLPAARHDRHGSAWAWAMTSRPPPSTAAPDTPVTLA